jgi:hypothetical protein
MVTINNDISNRSLYFELIDFNGFKVGAVEQATNCMNY